jgi:hypothetical protein
MEPDDNSPAVGRASCHPVPAHRPGRTRPRPRIGLAGLAARLPGQPIFYPVLNQDYATKIARDWNVPHSGIGYVTSFKVAKASLDNYEIHQVGGQTILEYWIPAEALAELNASIIGTIEVIAAYTAPARHSQE